MKTKNVIIFQPYITPYRNQLFNEINNFEDINLHILYIDKKSEDRKWIDILKINFREHQIKCKIKKISYERNKSYVNIFHLIKILIRIRPHIIISPLNKYIIIIKYILFFYNIKFIHWSEATLITENGLDCYKKFPYHLHKDIINAFIFPGRLSLEYHKFCNFKILNNYFIAPNSIDDIFKIDIKEIDEKFDSLEIYKFIFVGSFITLKGFELLNIAIDKVKENHKNFEIKIYGAGPIKPNNYFINMGFLSKEEMANEYKKAHVFILPSLWDCNPLSAIEAAKCGCILLLSDGVGNYPELIFENGFTFSRNSIDDIVNNINKIFELKFSDLKRMSMNSINQSLNFNHIYSANIFYNAIQYVTKEK